MAYQESINKNIDINQVRLLRKSIGWQPRSEKKWKEINRNGKTSRRWDHVYVL